MVIISVRVHYFISEQHYLKLAFVGKASQPLDDGNNFCEQHPRSQDFDYNLKLAWPDS